MTTQDYKTVQQLLLNYTVDEVLTSIVKAQYDFLFEIQKVQQKQGRQTNET